MGHLVIKLSIVAVQWVSIYIYWIVCIVLVNKIYCVLGLQHPLDLVTNLTRNVTLQEVNRFQGICAAALNKLDKVVNGESQDFISILINLDNESNKLIMLNNNGNVDSSSEEVCFLLLIICKAEMSNYIINFYTERGRRRRNYKYGTSGTRCWRFLVGNGYWGRRKSFRWWR